MESNTGHVEEVYRRTFGSSSFTRAPQRLDRTAMDNERAEQERVRRYGQPEPPSTALYRAMKPDETVAQLQDIERDIRALGREKRRMDSDEFVERLAQSSKAHQARVAGRSRRHARNQAARARYDTDKIDAERYALMLEEEMDKLDDGLWDPRVKTRANRSGHQYQADRKRWHHERMEFQMIRDERSDPAFRRPSRKTAWEDNRPPCNQSALTTRADSNPTVLRSASPALDGDTYGSMASDGLHQRFAAGANRSDGWVGVLGTGAHWVGSEPSAQAELLALRHSIEVQQLHAQQMLQELQARQIVESELEWQLMQRQEQRIGPSHPPTAKAYHHMGYGAAGWPTLPSDDDESEPYPLDIF